MYMPREKRFKFDTKAQECIFVDYCVNSKGYKLADVNNPRKIMKARDVIFTENQSRREKKQFKFKTIID